MSKKAPLLYQLNCILQRNRASYMQELTKLLYNDLPKKPYYSWGKGCRAIISGKSTAVKAPYIQINSPQIRKWLILDLDYSDSFNAHEYKHLPPPNIIIRNPKNGHCQYLYRLAEPVTFFPNSASKPINYLEMIEKALVKAYGADWNFRYCLSKNPMYKDHKTHLIKSRPYELGELADWLNFDKFINKPANDEEYGRNNYLFNTLRHVAYPIAPEMDYSQLYAHLVGLSDKYNLHFDEPLPLNETHGICRSITKYCKGNKKIKSDRAFSELQRARITKRWGDSTEKKKQAQIWANEGVKRKVIAERLGVTTRTLRNWLN